MSEAVVVFGKSPEPGRVKTRLAKKIGEKMAARLYEAFARDVFEMARQYKQERGRDGREPQLILAWEGAEEGELAQDAVKQGFEFMEQGSGDLGERLKRIVKKLRLRGIKYILILGTDSPTLMVEQLRLARQVLRRRDVVFGPSFDGGYFLVGLGPGRGGFSAPEEVIFDEISWSTAQVMEQSWRRAERAGLLSDLLGFWYDIDTFEDLKYLYFHLTYYLEPRDPQVGQFTRQLLDEISDRLL